MASAVALSVSRAKIMWRWCSRFFLMCQKWHSILLQFRFHNMLLSRNDLIWFGSLSVPHLTDGIVHQEREIDLHPHCHELSQISLCDFPSQVTNFLEHRNSPSHLVKTVSTSRDCGFDFSVVSNLGERPRKMCSEYFNTVLLFMLSLFSLLHSDSCKH